MIYRTTRSKWLARREERTRLNIVKDFIRSPEICEPYLGKSRKTAHITQVLLVNETITMPTEAING